MSNEIKKPSDEASEVSVMTSLSVLAEARFTADLYTMTS